MYIQTPEEYQEALLALETLQNKGLVNLTTKEKSTFNETLRAIEAYQFRNDPVSVLATYA